MHLKEDRLEGYLYEAGGGKISFVKGLVACSRDCGASGGIAYFIECIVEGRRR